MGRKWTDAERKAASEKAKARRAAEQKQTPQTQQTAPTIDLTPPEPKDHPMPPQDYGDIAKIVEEMVNQRMQGMMTPWMQPPQTQSPQFSRQGMVGTRDRYILDPKHYPNPTERLSNEQALRRHAFKDNYELKFQVSVSQYQTKDGINTREPKFTLELHRVMYDEETGEKTNRRYIVCRAVFHEDPDAALAIAAEKGIDIEDVDEREFLDEMRYLRMRDWLLEAFQPPRKSDVDKFKPKDMVIGNKVVQVFEIDSESSAAIPFDKISQSKKL